MFRRSDDSCWRAVARWLRACGLVIGAVVALALARQAVPVAAGGGEQASAFHAERLQLAQMRPAAKQMRPAAKGESPEQAEMKKLPPPAKPEQVRRPSKAELLQACEGRPACRGKLQAAKKGQHPAQPRPAAKGESPEQAEMKKLPPPAKPEVLRRFQHGDLWPPPGGSLLAWLSPFHATVAEAQTPVSLYFPMNQPVRYSGNPYSYVTVYYGMDYGTLSYPILTSNNIISGSGVSEGRPYAVVGFNAPYTGSYIIDIRASRAKAKLRHQYNGPIIEDWDFTGEPCSTCDYATMEYLQQGSHSFYFWAVSGYPYLYSVSIESYP